MFRSMSTATKQYSSGCIISMENLYQKILDTVLFLLSPHFYDTGEQYF